LVLFFNCLKNPPPPPPTIHPINVRDSGVSESPISCTRNTSVSCNTILPVIGQALVHSCCPHTLQPPGLMPNVCLVRRGNTFSTHAYPLPLPPHPHPYTHPKPQPHPYRHHTCSTLPAVHWNAAPLPSKPSPRMMSPPLQIVFHLQTRSPPILPPICHLFDLPANSISQRPLHRGRTPDMYLLEVPPLTTPLPSPSVDLLLGNLNFGACASAHRSRVPSYNLQCILCHGVS